MTTKFLFKLICSLGIVSTTVYSTLSVTYDENCFIQPNSKVAWVITFRNLTLRDVNEVKMQTQSTSPFKGEWRNLTGCQVLQYHGNVSVLCQIDDAWFRLTYNVRVLRFDESTTTGSEVLFRKNDQYQHGLLCFKDHGVLNLTYSQLTTTSVNILWSFYVWDIKEELIKETNIFIYTADEIWRRIGVQKNRHLRQLYRVKWLTPCTQYRIVVESTYFSLGSNEKRNSSVNVRTECYRRTSRDMLTTVELIIINACVLVIVILLVIGCKVYRNGRWYTGKQDTSIDNIVLIDEEGYYTLSHQTDVGEGEQ